MKEVNEIIQQIKKGELKPVYAFDGEEPYYIDVLCDAFEQYTLQPHEKDFNQTIFYGKDSDWQQIANECRSYPAFATRRLVILKEAAQLKGFNELEAYVNAPLASTVFVIAHKYKKIDGRTSITKAIKKQGVYVSFDKIKDYNLSDWILNYCTSKQIKMTPSTADLLGAYLGNDLQKIANELDKVLLNVGNDKTITPDLIEKFIGISKEYNVFQYQAAIMEKNTEGSFRIANYFIANPKEVPLVVITATLYAQFAKLYQYHYLKNLPAKELAGALKINPYFVKDYQKSASYFSLAQTITAIELLHEYNLKSIGVNSATNEITLLKELTAKLLSA